MLRRGSVERAAGIDDELAAAAALTVATLRSPMPEDLPPLVALDANVVDDLARPDEDVAPTVRHFVATGRIRLFISSGVAAELGRAGTLVDGLVIETAATAPRPRLTAEVHIDRIRVRAILRGDGRPGKHDSDAAHLSEAAERGCRYFVTRDGKILRKRDALAAVLRTGPLIVTPAELVAAIGGAP